MQKRPPKKNQHLRFGKAELTPDELSRLSKAQKREMYAAHAARSAVHHEVDQYEDENVGVQALSEGEKAAGNVRDIFKSRYARKLKKKAKMQGKKGSKTAKSSASEPTAAQDAGASGTGEGGSNWLSRWKQRQEIHKSYYAAARSGMAAAFFGNSGAEANEGLLKLARKYSHDKYGAGRGTILTLRNSFHGRTLATLAATGQDVFHQHVFPFPEGFRHTGANDLADVEAQAGEDVCAVLLELVQGEGGVLPMDRDFVRALAGLCEQRDWLLLVDEVQTGIGRTGTLFAFQQYGIRPDAVSFAKGIAGGLPMGGFLVNEKCRPVLGPGSHASTFGGNPVCSAAALAVLDILDEAALNRVREKGAYLREHIEAMGKQCLGATRGLGLMIGVEVRPDWSSRELAARLAGHGLLVLTAGPALRLLPPLTITKGEMDQGLAILDRGLE